MDVNYLVSFEVRNDKDRGILVLTVRLSEKSYDVHFFKYHHQPIDQHPEQIQRIVRQVKPTIRTKSVLIDISSYAEQYWNMSGNFFEFKGSKLNSSEKQVLKVQESRITKEIAAIKRKNTIEASKKNKDEAIREKLANDETKFQLERAKRIKEATKDIMETSTAGTRN